MVDMIRLKTMLLINEKVKNSDITNCLQDKISHDDYLNEWSSNDFLMSQCAKLSRYRVSSLRGHSFSEQ
jgi:hypothetical protein